MNGEKPPEAGGEPPSNGASGPERYGATYFQVDAAQRKNQTAAAPSRRVRRMPMGKTVVAILLAGAAVAYWQRARLLLWLESQPALSRLVQTVQPRPESPQSPEAQLPLTSMATPQPASGGVTTFSFGPGFGTVSPDDGSDSFRVDPPPGGGRN